MKKIVPILEQDCRHDEIADTMYFMKHQANAKSYEHLLIKKFRYWSVYLHENQCYLGRLVIWSHHEKFIDIFDLDEKALKELTLVSRVLKRALDDLFAPDLYNWASLANVVRHQHVHLIPRYSRIVEQSGLTFTDSSWGKNYAPYDESFALPSTAIESIRSLIASKLDDQEKLAKE